MSNNRNNVSRRDIDMTDRRGQVLDLVRYDDEQTLAASSDNDSTSTAVDEQGPARPRQRPLDTLMIPSLLSQFPPLEYTPGEGLEPIRSLFSEPSEPANSCQIAPVANMGNPRPRQGATGPALAPAPVTFASWSTFAGPGEPPLRPTWYRLQFRRLGGTQFAVIDANPAARVWIDTLTSRLTQMYPLVPPFGPNSNIGPPFNIIPPFSGFWTQMAWVVTSTGMLIELRMNDGASAWWKIVHDNTPRGLAYREELFENQASPEITARGPARYTREANHRREASRRMLPSLFRRIISPSRRPRTQSFRDRFVPGSRTEADQGNRERRNTFAGIGRSLNQRLARLKRSSRNVSPRPQDRPTRVEAEHVEDSTASTQGPNIAFFQNRAERFAIDRFLSETGDENANEMPQSQALPLSGLTSGNLSRLEDQEREHIREEIRQRVAQRVLGRLPGPLARQGIALGSYQYSAVDDPLRHGDIAMVRGRLGRRGMDFVEDDNADHASAGGNDRDRQS